MRKRTWKKGMQKALAVAMVAAMAVPQSIVYATDGADTDSLTAMTDEEVEALGGKVVFDRQGVHDPSIVVTEDGYYVFGSHMAVAKTDDLMNWSSPLINGENEDNAYFGTRDTSGNVTKISYNSAFLDGGYGEKEIEVADGSKVTVDFSTFPASEWNCAVKYLDKQGNLNDTIITGNMWAPDVIWNDNMDKWCMYLSLNGAKHNSVVILLTADNIEGPYVYEAPIVYSGFSTNEATSYEDTDMYLVLNDGVKENFSLPSRYDGYISGDASDGSYTSGSYGTYWPHAIDPTVYYDDDNNLWLLYGSWSGGIYTIELDENTGLRDYTVTYPYEVNGSAADDTVANANVTSDPYFGTKIAGGRYVSGEGAYVEKIGDYFYLFISYGFYSPTGGYNMRVFRSENPDGPFVNEAGESAVYTSNADNYRNDSKGVQLMGNYKWNTMSVGEVAQGHNSAFVDENGNAYVIYHTKYDDDTAAHNIRVHQLYTNEKGWLVAAPYEYSGETVNDEDIAATEVPVEDIVGDYDLIVHQYSNPKAADEGTVANNLDVVTPVTVTLNEDGTITGAYTGTWSETDGTAYATITIDETAYYGVFTEQSIDGTTIKVMCFSASSDAGKTIWGSKAMTDQQIIAYNTAFENVKVPSATKGDIPLITEGEHGATITWTSSDADVITNEGVVTQSEGDRKVTLTKTIACGDYKYDIEYDVVVYGTCTGAEEAVLSFDNIEAGTEIIPADVITADTGVSISFTATGITSDWTPVLVTDNGEWVYLSVINYGGANAFEAAGTMSSEASTKYVWPHLIFADGATYKATISYNTDGTITFYRDDVLMLTYAANTAIGANTVANLVNAMISAFGSGAVTTKYNMADVTVDYAKDYVKTNTGHTYTATYDSATAKITFACGKCDYKATATLTGATIASTYTATMTDGVITLPTESQLTAKEGYKFDGWLNKADGSELTRITLQDVCYGGDSITLEAQWAEISSGDDGSGTEDEDSEQNNSGVPSISGKDDKTGWDNIVTEIKDKASDNETLQEVVVDMNGAKEVPKSVFAEIQGHNIDLKLNMKNGITWVINGESVTKADIDKLDMSVVLDTNNIPKAALETVTKGKASRTLTLTYDGDFGFTAKLTVNVGAGNAAKKAILYYYNETTGKMEPYESNVVTEKGDVTFVFLHASEYVIVLQDVDANANENFGDGAPGTGDMADIAGNVWTMTISLAVIAGIIVDIKLKKKQKKA